MNRERVLTIYQELERLQVPLQNDPQMGLSYLKERMILCRAHQDLCNNLLVEVNREFGRIRQAVRTQKALLAVTAELQQQQRVRRDLENMENEEDSLRYLLEAAKAKSSNLRMTSSDIRLLCSLVEQQMRSGEVDPRRIPQTPDPIRNSVSTPEALAEMQTAIELSSYVPVVNTEALTQQEPLSVATQEENTLADIESFLSSEEQPEGVSE